MKVHRRPPFTRRLLLVAALALLAAVLPSSFAAAAEPAARPIINVPFRGVSTPATTFDLVESVIDFSAGAKSSVITTRTPHYLSVIAGELTVEVDGKADAVAAGAGVSAPTGAKLTMSNTSAGVTARVFVTTLLGVGAVDDVHQLSSPGVKVFLTARRTMANAPATVDVIHGGAQYDVGYRTPTHVMNEFHLMISLAGQTGYHYLDGGFEKYGPGSQAVMYEGRPGWMANEGQDQSSSVWTWLGTPGKPLSSAVTAPAPPSTGTGVARPASASAGSVALAGAALVALGCLGLGAFAMARRAGKRSAA